MVSLSLGIIPRIRYLSVTRGLLLGKGLADPVDEKDLVVAKEIVRRRFIVGLMSDMEE